jgi:chemotaxis signal transduction protein
MDNSSIHPADAEASLSASLSSVPSTDLSPTVSVSPSERYILTQVGTQQLVFPSHWVAEILLVERSQILSLPFYAPMLLGVVHHHGRIIPLVAIWQVLEDATAPTRETLSVVQLNSAATGLAGVGIVVDRASDNRSREQLPADLFDSTASLENPESAPERPPFMQLFHPKLLGDNLWHPQRWRPTDFDRFGSVDRSA